MTNEKIKAAELARRLGVTRGAVSKAIKTGRISLGEDGLIDADAAIVQWQANTRPNMKPTASPAAKNKATGYGEARARKESALAALAELRVQRAEGKLVRLADVDFVLANYGTYIRNRLESVPDRWTPVFLSLTKFEEFHSALARMVFEELTAIADHGGRGIAELQRDAENSKDED